MTKAEKTSTPHNKRRRKSSDKEQYERFRQVARELGTDESEEAFERAFRTIMRQRDPPKSQQ